MGCKQATVTNHALAACCLGVLVGTVTPAGAQTGTPPTDLQTKGGTLSDKLKQTDGIIHPQGDLDAGMQKPAPSGGAGRVVPPPGSPGRDPSVTPK